jgi:hypothetical protein
MSILNSKILMVKTKTIGPIVASLRLIPSNIPELNERISEEKFEEYKEGN